MCLPVPLSQPEPHVGGPVLPKLLSLRSEHTPLRGGHVSSGRCTALTRLLSPAQTVPATDGDLC